MRRLTAEGGDRGAIAIVVALTMTLLVLAVGLAVDLSAGYAQKQAHQNSADAAALAVARECIIHEQNSNCTNGADRANEYAAANAVDLDPVGGLAVAYPRNNVVTVTVQSDRENSFISVVPGLRDTTVRSQASVAFGSPVSAAAVIPIAVPECLVPDDGTIKYGDIVEFWAPKGNGDDIQDAAGCESAGYPAGGFGWLDTHGCIADVDLGDMVVPGTPGNSVVSECKDKSYFKNLADSGAEVLIPIYDVYEGGGSPATYSVIKFMAIKLIGFESGTGTYHNAIITCSEPPEWSSPNGSNKYCFRAQFIRFIDDPGDVDLGTVNGISFTRFIDPGDI